MTPEVLGYISGVDGQLYRITLCTLQTNAESLLAFLKREECATESRESVEGFSFVRINISPGIAFADGHAELDRLLNGYTHYCESGA
ncbi:MAG: hypothetical protein AABP62_07460 [Planctomycetota bacterium]